MNGGGDNDDALFESEAAALANPADLSVKDDNDDDDDDNVD